MPTLSVCLIFSSIRTERPELASCRILQPPAEIVCSSIRTETDLFLNPLPATRFAKLSSSTGRDILVVNEQTSLSGRKQTRPHGRHNEGYVGTRSGEKADTLDEMAKLINVPADHLKAAVAEYNKAHLTKALKTSSDLLQLTQTTHR